MRNTSNQIMRGNDGSIQYPDRAGFKISTTDRLKDPYMPTTIGSDTKNRILRGSQFSVIPSFLRKGSGFIAGQKIQSFKKGGMIHKTGIYRLHKGEMVVPKDSVDKMHKTWMLSDSGATKM